MNDAIATIKKVTDGILPVAPVLAGLILVVIGLLWITAKDQQKKEMYTGWMLNVVIGFAIVYLGASIVTWLSGSVVGFR